MKNVIIGAGAAGIAAARTIRKLDRSAEVTVISADEQVYSRCMLHHVIAGKKTPGQISFIEPDFFADYAIEWLNGVKVKQIDFEKREILLENQQTLAYERLLIATGADATIPPIPGLGQIRNSFKLRNLSDVTQISALATPGKKTLVIGAGLVGLDAAAGLLAKGVSVVIVEKAERVLPLQLDAQAAANYQKLYQQSGAQIFTATAVAEVVAEPDGRIRLVRLQNGVELECDLIVAATGVKANRDFITDSRLRSPGGIEVDERMQTAIPNVYAAGDVTGKSAIWPLAVKQGTVAAYNMVGIPKQLTDCFTAKNSINLLGLETVALGLPQAPDSSFQVDTFNRNGIYKKVVYKDGVVYGVILQKDIAHCGFWTQLIKERVKLPSGSANIFNLSYADFYKIDSNGQYQYETPEASGAAVR